MTIAAEAAREGSAAAETAAPDSTAEGARARVASVTLPSSAALTAFTQRVRKTGARAAALADRPGSLVHSQPPTFHQSHARHHEAAWHYEALLLRCPRLLWGYFHLLAIKPLLNFLEWVTESPARFFVALAIAAVIWIWR